MGCEGMSAALEEFPLPRGERVRVRGFGVREFLLASDTPSLPLRSQVRPPDEPKSGRNPSRGRG
jgi:hypothetical protein